MAELIGAEFDEYVDVRLDVEEVTLIANQLLRFAAEQKHALDGATQATLDGEPDNRLEGVLDWSSRVADFRALADWFLDLSETEFSDDDYFEGDDDEPEG